MAKGVNLTDLIDRLIDPRVPTQLVAGQIDDEHSHIFLDLSAIGLVGPLKMEEVEFLRNRRQLLAQKITEAYNQASTNGKGTHDGGTEHAGGSHPGDDDSG